MNAVQWKMELLDRVSGPARRILDRVDRIENAHKRLDQSLRVSGGSFGGWAQQGERAAKRVEQAFERAHRRVSTIGRGIGNLQSAAWNVGAAAAPVIGAGYLGKAVLDGAGAREGSLMSLSTLLKTQNQTRVRGAASWIDNFADVTPFGDQDVMQSVRQLLAAQFSFDGPGMSVQRLARITGDAASALGNDPGDSAMKWTIINRALGQIKAKGRLQGDEVLQLNEAGIGTDKYLQKAFGPNYRKLQEAGRITGTAAIKAITEGLESDFGGAMERQSQTLFGLTSTLRSRPQRLFGRLFDEGGLDDAKRFMRNLVNLTDFSKPPGSRIITRLTASGVKLTRALFGPLADATGGARGEQTIDRLLDKLDEFSGWWETHGPRIARDARGFGEGLKLAADGAMTLVKPLVWLAGLADRATGGDGEGMLGKILGVGVGAAVLGRIGNFLSFGLLGKLGHRAGATLLGGIRTAAQSVLTRGVLGELLTHPQGLLAGARTAFAGLAGRAGLGALLGQVPVVGWIITGLTTIKAAGDAAYNTWDRFAALIDRISSSPVGRLFTENASTATGFNRALHFDPVKWAADKLGITPEGQRGQAWERANGGFMQSLGGVASRLGISTEDLLAIMNKESSLNPGAVHRNKAGTITAAGLIQFQEGTARELGTSLAALRNMSREEQLPFVERYLQMHGVKAGMNREQLYMSILAGSANRSGVLWERGSSEYAGNFALDTDSDGKITSTEATQAVNSAWARDKAYQVQNLNLTINASGGDPEQVRQASQQGVLDAFTRMSLEMGYGGPPQ